MELFFQQLVNGTSLGALYALIAVGYTVVYGIVQLINFAHGEIFMVGAFGAFGHWLLIVAHGYASAGILAPFIYTQIVWMTALGWVIVVFTAWMGFNSFAGIMKLFQ